MFGTNYSYENFIKLLKTDYKIAIEYKKNKTLYDSKYFPQIIIHMDQNTSDNIMEYKQIYFEFTNALDRASDKIIQFNKKLLEKNENISRYLRNYVEYDLNKNNDRSLLKDIYEKLKPICDK
jgi:hypothetical protein